ncbi:MAG: DUF2914 domain-containing protein [candidate division KSB1 bacterium]|nr:DUF2914 domain-containing protein [candidate division KSB1 bacterium]
MSHDEKPAKSGSRSIFWFFELILLIVGFIFVYRHLKDEETPAGQTAVKSNPATIADSPHQMEAGAAALSFRSAVVCIDIDEETLKPLLAKGVFSKYIDYLYCFAEFAPPAPQEVVFYWKHRDVTIAQLKAKVQGGRRPVAWTRLNMTPEKTGIWQVDIRTTRGDYLGSAEFILK